MVGKLVVVTVGMFAFGYALVPMYKAICELTGINVLALGERKHARATPTTPANTQVDTSRTITVEFDANSRGPWEFKPAQRSMQVHPGEMATVMYEFQNVQNRRMSAQAIPSYAPKQAQAHFNKLECFCFNQYTLEPGEKSVARGVCDRSQAVQGCERPSPCRTPFLRWVARRRQRRSCSRCASLARS